MHLCASATERWINRLCDRSKSALEKEGEFPRHIGNFDKLTDFSGEKVGVLTQEFAIITHGDVEKLMMSD